MVGVLTIGNRSATSMLPTALANFTWLSLEWDTRAKSINHFTCSGVAPGSHSELKARMNTGCS